MVSNKLLHFVAGKTAESPIDSTNNSIDKKVFILFTQSTFGPKN